MHTSKQKKIAMFRFGVISELVGRKNMERGERERLLRDITEKNWDIPYSDRTSISRGTVLLWYRKYIQSGRDITSLMPVSRSDRGRSRKIDKETELALVCLKKENPKWSVPVMLEYAKEKGIVPYSFNMSLPAIYRILNRHLSNEEYRGKDRRRFEAQLPNDIWQSDCMHGPLVEVNGKKRKTFLFALIDDHSRLIPHAEFYLKENTVCFMDCLKQAFAKRGLPAKLYTDNGSCFRSARLEYTTARLGVALIHARPYTPESKGKIERWFRTVRDQFLSRNSQLLTLDKLNERLQQWIDREYHERAHSSTSRKPIKRYTDNIELIRSAPKDLDDHFRIRCQRRVNRDRSVRFRNNIFLAPVGLTGKKIDLVYYEGTPEEIEVFWNERSYGKLEIMNPHLNSEVLREGNSIKSHSEDIPVTVSVYEGGSLFRGGDSDE